jgi:hypothetical protein
MERIVRYQNGDLGFISEGIQGPAGSLSGKSAADIDMDGYGIRNVDVITFALEKDNGDSGPAITIHLADAVKQIVRITEPTMITIDATDSGCTNYQILLVQDEVGWHPVAFAGLDDESWIGSVGAPSVNMLPGGKSVLGIYFGSLGLIQGLSKVGAA